LSRPIGGSIARKYFSADKKRRCTQNTQIWTELALGMLLSFGELRVEMNRVGDGLSAARSHLVFCVHRLPYLR
jgi:hypothetical protein